MTCREKLKIEYPDEIDVGCDGGCRGCPSQYDYLPNPEYCGETDNDCWLCWDREIPETGKPRILDSGTRREFDTGAVRDIAEGKGRCDLIPLDVAASLTHDPVLYPLSKFQSHNNIESLGKALEQFIINYTPWCPDGYYDSQGVATMLLEVSKHFEEGAKKYGEHNWQKGIPVHCYIDSAVRHYLKHKRGDKDEPHDRAFVWNILCCMWTCIHKPELNDYPFVQNNNESEE